jgi:hypothetical protein
LPLTTLLIDLSHAHDVVDVNIAAGVALERLAWKRTLRLRAGAGLVAGLVVVVLVLAVR